MTLSARDNLGPYEILSPLGAGGMGEVYRARDTRLDRDVAIKVLPDATANDPAALTRFEREAKAVAALSHPNIVALHDVGRHENTSYVVMELLEGQTLRQRISQSALSPRRAVEVGIAIADGLAEAHSRGVIHRDLKPENIFLTTDGLVKILDFGLARSSGPIAPGQDSANSPTLTVQTTPGSIIGTLCYMAPEQIRGALTDARTDIFAFGCVMYEMLTGKRAFLGETAADTMTAILKEDPTSVRTANSGVGLELERLIDRCLEKRPEQRFQSAADLAFALRTTHSAVHQVTVRSGSRRMQWIAVGAAVLLASPALIILYSDILRTPSGSRRIVDGDVIDSLAVLPFENVSRDPEQEYFVDGMTEALISDLARIRSLKVISRTSVMRYKNTTKSLPEIARELNVVAVVEGSVLRVGDRVRITTQLIHAPTDDHLWSESYDRDLRDVLTLQGEVAKTIAQEIKATLTPQEKAQVAKDRAVNPEAYQAYLKGRFYWNKRSPDGIRKAVEYFEQAVALDPDWPLGYAGLADAYALQPNYASGDANQAMPKAKQAATKALSLDDSLGEAHATLGLIATIYQWDWPAAEREFQRALELSPNYATAHHWYALYLRITGRHDESLRAITKAGEIDPLSLIIGSVSSVFRYGEEFAQAETMLRKTLELDPTFAYAHGMLAKSLFLQNRTGEAIAEAGEAVRLSNNDARYAAILAYICAKGNRRDEARQILSEVTARLEAHNVAPSQLALIYAGFGEVDQFFEWLERAYQERDVNLLLDTQLDPLLHSLRSDPRFLDLARRLGLPTRTVSSDKRPSQEIMLAVLPFANDSGDADLDYLSDGIAETLINTFSRLEGLRTVPRSTAFRHRGSNVDPVQAGKGLSATALLSGRVLKRGENLTIQAELIDVVEGRQLWGERYQRKDADLVEIERDIAKEITDALRLRLTGEQRKSLSRGYSQDSEAYRLYLQGRYWWTKRTREGFDTALRLFNEAVEIDPRFALAFSGIADTYSLLPLYGWMSPKDAADKAGNAASTALQLDEGLAEAHTSMGMVWFYLRWEFEKADREFQRAEQLNPRYATAQQWWGLCIGARGQFAQARAKMRRALELDPLAPIFTHNLAWIQMWEGDWNEALATAQSGLDFAPDFFLLHQSIGLSQLSLNHPEEAVDALRKGVQMSNSASFAYAYLAHGLGRSGHKAECQAMIDEWLGQARQRYIPPTDIAIMYLGVDNHEEAIAWLEKGYEQRDVWMSFLAVLRFWDPLRDDPRFVSLLRRIGLPVLPPVGNPSAPP